MSWSMRKNLHATSQRNGRMIGKPQSWSLLPPSVHRTVMQHRLLQSFGCSSNSVNTNNRIVRTYVLPDFTPESTNKLGYVRTGQTPPPTPPPVDPNNPDQTPASAVQDEEQLLYLCNERFTVPEALFTPTTIGELTSLSRTTLELELTFSTYRVEPSWIGRVNSKLDQCVADRTARDVLEQYRLRRWKCWVRRVRSTTVSLSPLRTRVELSLTKSRLHTGKTT